MTHERKNEIFKELFDSCLELQYSKAKDYASNSDALSNFKSQDAEALGLTPFQKWGVYFGKQAMSILGAIGKNPNYPSTTSEPIEERINDAIIYLVLFKCLLEDINYIPENRDFNALLITEMSHTANILPKVTIDKNEDSYTFHFSEKIDKLEKNPHSEFYVFNENNPYTQYKCQPLQIIRTNVYDCKFVEKRQWDNNTWVIKSLPDEIELEKEDTWFLAV